MNHAELLQVVAGATPTTRGFLIVNFGKEITEPVTLSASIDWNRDGEFQKEEVVVTNAPADPRKNWNGNFPIQFQRADDLSNLTVHLTVGNESFDLPLTLTTYDVGELVDFSTVTKPDESMKGDTVVRPPAAPKAEGVPQNFHNDTPDITQRKDECAPTTAANGFIQMAGDHGRIDAIPRDPMALVDMFKKEMGWTFQNGVLIEDFSTGKDYVARQLDLPIHSETVTGDFNHVVDKIEEALAGGGAAEMRVQAKVTDAKGKVHNVGGHVVSVTRVIRNGQSLSLEIHDPLSPAGTEPYDIDPNDGALSNYPFLGGKESESVRISVSVAFLQTWNDGPRSIIDDLQPISRSTIKVIVVDGHKIPISEVHVSDPDLCDGLHYHANRGVAKALDGTMVAEVFEHCGYGKVEEVPVEDCKPDGTECKRMVFKK